jgi:hypothetical protein
MSPLGHRDLHAFSIDDLTTHKPDMAKLTRVAYGRVGSMRTAVR